MKRNTESILPEPAAVREYADLTELSAKGTEVVMWQTSSPRAI